MLIMPSLLNFFVIGLSVLIFTFFWRVLAAHLADRPIGRAMAAVYS